MRYRPQLDGLRALAVIGVLTSHFWLEHLELGHLGVRLFFVLSGFLISSILLGEGPSASFYVRRAARLWPAFYAALALSCALDLPGMRATWPWHAAQLSNVFFSRYESWDAAWPAAHLWSLNVEEQFYLVWPFVIGVLPRRRLVPVMWSLIGVAVIYDLAFGSEFLSILPLASLDALAGGALLAIAKPRLGALGWLMAPFAIASIFCATSEWSDLLDVAAVVPLAALVQRAADGFGGRMGSCLERLAPLGKISYGIYLYHLPLLAIAYRFGWPFGLGWQTFGALSALSIAVAAASYHYFERPLRDLVRVRLHSAVSA